MPFNLQKATDILNLKYEAKHIDPYSKQDGLDAEIPFTLDGEHLLIEISVNSTSIIATEVHALVIGPPIESGSLESIRLEKKSNSYLKHAKIVSLLGQIKTDLEIP